MATTETITILKVNSEQAVTSINDLKENIKVLKENLNGLIIGSDKYQSTLSELKVNQNALKDAMYATSASMEDLAKSATGTSETYNSLVHRMAAMKEELRNTDISTESGKQRFKELAEQVNSVNDKLKEMDALQGNYQRNVGNYKSALSDLGGILKQMPPTLGATKEKLSKVGETMQLVGKQPILGIIGLLAPMLMKIGEQLKGNATATQAIKKAMDALQPVLNLATGMIEKLAGWLTKAVDLFVKMAGESGGTFEKIIAGAVGVGNVLLQYMLTPIKSIISAFKGLGNIVKDVFTGEFSKIKDDAVAAWDGVKDAFSKGFDFKDNFAKGQEVGAKFLDGLKNSGKAEEAGEAIGEQVVKGVENKILSADALDKLLAEADRKAEERRRAALDAQKALDADILREMADTDAEIEQMLSEADAVQEVYSQGKQERAKVDIATLQRVAAATSDLLSNIADMYESDEENSEKNAGKIKALRIASATIDTISGAIGAFMQATATIPPPFGQIVGGIQAAAITAAGIANINKIRNTKVGSSDTSSSTSAAAFTEAPSVTTNVTNVRSITSATEEERLNQMAGEQRVYILSSDIEASQNARRTQVAEASF